MDLDVATAYSYGEAGAFIDLSEYYERGLAVNVSKAVEEFPDWNLLSNITNYDGSIYAVPKIQASPSNETKYKLWINQTYLDNLGLDMPTTTDEFYEMLVAFPRSRRERQRRPPTTNSRCSALAVGAAAR